MQAFKKVDMESWPRREHYRYYTEALKVEFNMTAPVDVQNLLRFCHAHGYKFYAAAIYCVTKALGRIENFRMFKNADNELCVWDKIVPNFTFFHPDDCTFSDCWTDFSDVYRLRQPRRGRTAGVLSHRCHGQIRKMRRKGQYAGQYHHCTCGGRWIPRRFVLPVSTGGTGCSALNVQKSTLFFVKSVDFLIHSVQILPHPASAHPPSESPCRLSGSAAA